LLDDALHQTDWSGALLTQETWQEAVRERLHATSWNQAVADVRSFLASGADPALLTLENLRRLLIVG
jgi:hypothetical protein